MPQKSRTRPVPTSLRYRDTLAHAVLEATRALSSPDSRPVRGRVVVNFLRGSQLPGDDAHRGEPTFGLLVSHSARWLEELLDALIEAGYLSISESSRGPGVGLVLTRQGSARLDGPGTYPDASLPSRPKLGADIELEERLRTLRRELARQEGRSAYVIFPNATLAELAHRKPRSLSELAAVPGLGEARIRKYGRRILRAVDRRG